MKANLVILVTFVFLIGTVVAEKDYTDLVKSLQAKIKEAPFKGSSYDRLAYITDTYGPRMWGSSTLEQVIH
jgi:hypothetical protein